jgi:hypothetical protein
VSRSNDQLDVEVSKLAGLATDRLRYRWTELFGTGPANRISRDLLIRGIAYRLQEDMHGGLSKLARRQLARSASELTETGVISKSTGKGTKPGTKLIREWKGKVHEVVFNSDGYVWSGKKYRSLSQIARAITGTRWSGPRFFGLETSKGEPSGSLSNSRTARIDPEMADD